MTGEQGTNPMDAYEEPAFTSAEVLAILNLTPFPEKSRYAWRDGVVVWKDEGERNGD